MGANCAKKSGDTVATAAISRLKNYPKRRVVCSSGKYDPEEIARLMGPRIEFLRQNFVQPNHRERIDEYERSRQEKVMAEAIRICERHARTLDAK